MEKYYDSIIGSLTHYSKTFPANHTATWLFLS